jgi:hydrogenase maturation protease
VSDSLYVYGIGNPGRQDDGIGPHLADYLENRDLPGVIVDANYQLNVEDALNISTCGRVLFIDASYTCEEPFSFSEIEPDRELTFTTHSMPPGSVLSLCRDLYNPEMRGFVLGVRGYSWEFMEDISPGARQNLERAREFLDEIIPSLARGEEIAGLTGKPVIL